MPRDIDPRLVAIVTAPLWARRTVAVLSAAPVLLWTLIAGGDIAADLRVIDRLWSR